MLLKKIQGTRFKVQGTGFKAQEIKVQDFKAQAQGTRFKTSRYKIQGLVPGFASCALGISLLVPWNLYLGGFYEHLI